MVGLWLLTVLVAEIPILLTGMRDPALLWVGGVVVLAPVLTQVTRKIFPADTELRSPLILASAVLIVAACILASQLPDLALETNLDVSDAGSFEEVRASLREHGVDLTGELGMSREQAVGVRLVRAVSGGKP